ncbi:uncharacterized protein TNCV_4331131 [Trichonephila clavipes]|nr:uncharacterized protein TNCV_4331131 [Trichonephila clavipes]
MPPTSLPLLLTTREDLRVDGYLEYPHAAKGTIQLQTSMSSPGFEPNPYGTTQFLRAHYISTIWKNAYKKQPSTLEPLEYGWIEQDNTFILKWFEGDQLPSFVSDLITNIPESDSIDDEDDLYNDEHYPDDDE